MKVLTCAGYHGTGSSVVTDLLKEFEDCISYGEYEFRFVQDPYGISDLEYNLVENNHRLNSSNSIKKFKKFIDSLSGGKIVPKYEKYFNGEFKKISYKYIDDLTDIKYYSQWHQDLIEKGKLFYISYKLITKPIKLIVRKVTRKKEISFEINLNEKFYLSYPENKFYDITKKYTRDFCKYLNKDNKKVIALDQLVPPSNTNRYLRYFDDLYIVVVDRDPRDLFILEDKYWKDNAFPTKDVHEFIKWYKITRKHIENEINNDRVLRTRFEDFIYNYEETVKKICKLINLSEKNHIKKFQFFNPEISKNNTRLWIENKEYSNQIKIIEEQLREYCYEYV